jgi:transposase InsO family protein
LTSVLSFGLWVADITYVIQHSDQGRQYTAVAFGKRCREAGIRPPMGSVHDAYATRAVFEQSGDVEKSLDVGDAREVQIPAIVLRRAREGLLQVVVALRALEGLACYLESSYRRCG